MPEGDTLHKIARVMAPTLEGEAVERLWLRDRGDETEVAGRRIERIEAVGKHLLVRMAGDWVLRTHLGMKGSWHRYRPGEAWQRSRATATVELEAGGWIHVCFKASRVELLRAREAVPHPSLGHLGPDLLGAEFDLDRAVRRARERPDPATSVAEMLLDQRVAAGIGNVYKSELCFLERLHPATPLERVADDTLRALFRRARTLMTQNLHTRSRSTVPGGHAARGATRLYVYGRARRPCLRCGTAIRRAALGDQARATFWCPRCQGLGDPRTPRKTG